MNLRLPFVAFVTSVLLAALPARAEKTEFLFEIRSAEVEYQTTTAGKGVNNTGTETFWIADRGRKTARLSKTSSTTKFLGRTKTEQTENMAIVRDGWIYTYDLKTRAGTKMSLEQAQQMAESMGKGAKGQDARGYAKDFVEKNGGKWLGNETFLGRNCDVFELWGFKTWAYKGIALKTEGEMMGVKHTTVATKFDENASVPDSRFEVPKDVQLQDMSEMMGLVGGLFGGGKKRATADTAEVPAERQPAARKPKYEEREAEPEPAPAPEPKPKTPKKPKPAPQPSAGSVGMSTTQFEQLATKLHVAGHTTMAPESVGDGYSVNLLDTRGGAMGVTILPLATADQLEKSDALKVDSKFDHEGHAAIAGVLRDPAEGDSSILMVRYPERKLALLVSSTPVQPKEELMKLLAQIDL